MRLNQSSFDQVRFCIVLATTGGPFLKATLGSICSQLRKNDLLVLVDNSENQIELDEKTIPSKINYVVLRKPEQEGAAEAYNYGLRYAKDLEVDYIAIASDDDKWLKGRLETQFKYLSADSIVFGSAIYSAKVGCLKWSRKRPKRMIRPDQSILEYLYGKRLLFLNSRYLPAATIVFPASLASLEMKSFLICREDIWWLHEAQKLGYRLRQHKEPVVQVLANFEKDARRSNEKLVLEFAKMLPSNLQLKFLVYHSVRSRIASGNLESLRSLQKQIVENFSFETTLRAEMRAAFLFQRILCRVVKMAVLMGGFGNDKPKRSN